MAHGPLGVAPPPRGGRTPAVLRSPLLRMLLVFWAAIRIAWEFWRLDRAASALPEAELERRREALYRRQARRIRRLAAALQGLWIKLAQFLSTRVDVLPAAYTAELGQLQDLVPAFGFAQVTTALAEAYGPNWRGLFASFDPEPLAAASLGQVHRAELVAAGGEAGPGEPPLDLAVAVKVLRPGIERLVAADLAALLWIVRAAARWTRLGRQADLLALHRELGEVTGREMDYGLEAANLVRFRSHLTPGGPIRAPRVHATLTRRRVLVMEYVHGLRLDRPEALTAAGIAPPAVARLLVQTYVTQVLRDGFFHADPHPGNIFVAADGGLIFVDFGMMADVAAAERRSFGKLIVAAVTRDLDGVIAAVRDLGFLRQGANAPVLKKALAILIDQLAGKPWVAQADPSSAEFRTFLEEMRTFLYTEPFQLPAHYAFLGRAVGILLGVTSRLDPELRLLDLLRDTAAPYIGLPTGGAPPEEASGPGPGTDVLLAEVRATLLALWRLPRSVERMAEQLGRGSLGLTAETAGLERRLDALVKGLRGLTLIVAAGALAISASLLGAAGQHRPSALAWAGAAVCAILGWLRGR